MGSAFVLVAIVGSGGLPRADMAMLTVFVLASFETILPLPTAIQKAGEMVSAAERLFEILDANRPFPMLFETSGVARRERRPLRPRPPIPICVRPSAGIRRLLLGPARRRSTRPRGSLRRR